MKMNIPHSTLEDIDAIFEIYDAATTYQKTVTDKSWRVFKRELVEQEIAEGRHFKLLEKGKKVCTFVITYNDPTIYRKTIRNYPEHSGGRYHH